MTDSSIYCTNVKYISFSYRLHLCTISFFLSPFLLFRWLCILQLKDNFYCHDSVQKARFCFWGILFFPLTLLILAQTLFAFLIFLTFSVYISHSSFRHISLFISFSMPGFRFTSFFLTRQCLLHLSIDGLLLVCQWTPTHTLNFFLSQFLSMYFFFSPLFPVSFTSFSLLPSLSFIF